MNQRQSWLGNDMSAASVGWRGVVSLARLVDLGWRNEPRSLAHPANLAPGHSRGVGPLPSRSTSQRKAHSQLYQHSFDSRLRLDWSCSRLLDLLEFESSHPTVFELAFFSILFHQAIILLLPTNASL